MCLVHLREAAEDDCQWITKNGRHICITGGHGGHERGQAAPNKRSVSGDAGRALATSSRPGAPSRTQAVPFHTSATANPPSSTTRANAPSTLAGPLSILGTVDPTSQRIILQPINDVETLIARSREAAPLLNSSMDAIARTVPGVTNLGARWKAEKHLARLQQKLQTRPPNTVSDYVGARLSFDTPAAGEWLYQAIASRYPVIADENFMGSGKSDKGGYRARHLQILLPNGITAEIQMVPREIAAVQEEAHKHLNILQNRSGKVSAAEVETAQRASKAIFDGAWKGWVTRTGLQESVQAADCTWRTIGGRPVCITHPRDRAGPGPVEITTENIDHYRGAIQIPPGAVPTDVWAVFDRDAFDALGEEAALLPLAKVVSTKDELTDPKFLAGRKPDPRATVLARFADAAAGRLAKRPPITVTQRNGRYFVQDGNATVQVLMLAGWTHVPAQILTSGSGSLHEAHALLEFNPHHVPAGSPAGGQFTTADGGGSGGGDAAATGLPAQLVDRLRAPDGGFTYDAKTAQEPTRGYVVSPYPERSKPIHDVEHLTADALADQVTDYVIANFDLLSQSDHSLGGWHDPETGTVFLDVVQVKDTEAEATAIGLAKDQIAIYDIANQRTIVINRRAKSGQSS